MVSRWDRCRCRPAADLIGFGSCCATACVRAQVQSATAWCAGAVAGLPLSCDPATSTARGGMLVCVQARWEVEGCVGGPWGGWSLGWSSWRPAACRRMEVQPLGRPGAAWRSRRPARRRGRPQARPWARPRAQPPQAHQCRRARPPPRCKAVPPGTRRSPSALVTGSNGNCACVRGRRCLSSCSLGQTTSSGQVCRAPRPFSSLYPDGGWIQTAPPTPRCAVRAPGPVGPRSPGLRRRQTWQVRPMAPSRWTSVWCRTRGRGDPGSRDHPSTTRCRLRGCQPRSRTLMV